MGMPVVSALKSLRQEDCHKFRAIMGYLTACLKDREDGEERERENRAIEPCLDGIINRYG